MDTVFLGGNVLTMDPESRRAEAVAVDDGRIAAVGDSAEIAGLVEGDTNVVHLAGRTLTPGFIDPHNHFSMTAFEPLSVDCRMPPLDGVQGVLDAIAHTAKDSLRGKWIWGIGYNAMSWGEKRRLTRRELDEAAPDNPVCVMDTTYHACYANSAALELAGIDRHTPDPHRGWILKDDEGEPDGTLWERAMDPVHAMCMTAHIDHYGEEAVADLVHQNAMRHLSCGITSVGDALVTPDSARMYRYALDRGKLPIAIHQMRADDTFLSIPDRASKGGFPDDNVSDRLRGGIVKIFMDPAYPTWAMVRHHPDGRTEHIGERFYEQEEVDTLVLDAHSRGLQVAIHCIGEWAIEQGLNAFERAIKQHPSADPRFRIEHFITPSTAQIRRAASMGVIVSVQPAVISSLGDLLEGAAADLGLDTSPAPFKTMLSEGVILAAGSDFPCGPLAPLFGLQSMVSRTAPSGDRKIAPEEAVDPMDGLRMYTMGSAYAMFREEEVGSIEKGKQADMVVLSHDPTAVSTEYIGDIKVQQTYVDGELLFERV